MNKAGKKRTGTEKAVYGAGLQLNILQDHGNISILRVNGNGLRRGKNERDGRWVCTPRRFNFKGF